MNSQNGTIIVPFYKRELWENVNDFWEYMPTNVNNNCTSNLHGHIMYNWLFNLVFRKLWVLYNQIEVSYNFNDLVVYVSEEDDLISYLDIIHYVYPCMFMLYVIDLDAYCLDRKKYGGIRPHGR